MDNVESLSLLYFLVCSVARDDLAAQLANVSEQALAKALGTFDLELLCPSAVKTAVTSSSVPDITVFHSSQPRAWAAATAPLGPRNDLKLFHNAIATTYCTISSLSHPSLYSSAVLAATTHPAAAAAAAAFAATPPLQQFRGFMTALNAMQNRHVRVPALVASGCMFGDGRATRSVGGGRGETSVRAWSAHPLDAWTNKGPYTLRFESRSGGNSLPMPLPLRIARRRRELGATEVAAGAVQLAMKRAEVAVVVGETTLIGLTPRLMKEILRNSEKYNE